MILIFSNYMYLRVKPSFFFFAGQVFPSPRPYVASWIFIRRHAHAWFRRADGSNIKIHCKGCLCVRVTLTSACQDVFKLQACSFLLTLIISSFQTCRGFLFLSYLPHLPLWWCVPVCTLCRCFEYGSYSPDFRELLEMLGVFVTATILSCHLHSLSVDVVYSLWVCMS